MVIKELKENLENNGVKKGDFICVFSDITSFGIPAVIKNKVKASGINFLLDSYIDTFKDVVGREGLVVMPTFTYSATKNQIFDLADSKSEVGALTEYFRKQPQVVRSSHPIFSFAAWGNGAKNFLKLESYDCFGRKSILGKLHDAKAKYILLGAGMHESATFVLYSEQKNKVYYRYFKNFTGIIKDGKKKFELSVRYFVRDLNHNYSWRQLEKDALGRGIIKKFKFSGGDILLVDSRKIDGLIKHKLKENKNYLTIQSNEKFKTNN